MADNLLERLPSVSRGEQPVESEPLVELSAVGERHLADGGSE